MLFQKIRKIVPFLRVARRYPGVIYFGAPAYVSLFGAKRRPNYRGYHSQHGQDELAFKEYIEHAPPGRFPHVFIDVGCNHPTLLSNSYFFEHDKGYRVVAVDALSEIHAMWRKERPDAEFVECAVGASEGELSFDVVQGDDIDSMFSSVSGASQKRTDAAVVRRTVKVRRVADILAEKHIEAAAVVSMDIEGYELEALRGIDFSKFRAAVFIVENNGHAGLGSNALRDLMISNGYRYHGRVWNFDDVFVHPELISPQADGG